MGREEPRVKGQKYLKIKYFTFTAVKTNNNKLKKIKRNKKNKLKKIKTSHSK